MRSSRGSEPYRARTASTVGVTAANWAGIPWDEESDEPHPGRNANAGMRAINRNLERNGMGVPGANGIGWIVWERSTVYERIGLIADVSVFHVR